MNASRRAWIHGRRVLSILVLSLAASAAYAYPLWQADTFYAAGTIVTYNGADYMALVNQTDYAATGWNPTTASLWQPLGASSPPPTNPPPTNPPPSPPPTGGSGNCAPVWSATQVYTGGNTASLDSVNYTANYWTQGNNPATSNGGPGSGQPWTSNGSCSGGTTNPPPTDPPPTNPPPTTPPPRGFQFSPYKDITISMNWNTNVISSAVTGTLQPVLNVMPSHLTTLTWGFATGECGSETWAGLSGPAVAAANVQNFVSMGKFYVISTGGAAGSFRCGSDAGFDTFIRRYFSSNMLGVDFDIEAGQSQADIQNLIQRVIVAKRNFPNLRFSFTIATLGGNSPQSLGATGITVMNALRSSALTGYIVNLMTMDYGSTTPSNCVVVNGRCDMAQSAMAASENLHSFYGVPYNQIEITPMIGGNDTQDETFTIGNVSTVASYARSKGLAGVHFWSFDRDTDCAPGFASPICNSYGTAGRLGFTMQFLSSLGL
jgi:chitinase